MIPKRGARMGQRTARSHPSEPRLCLPPNVLWAASPQKGPGDYVLLELDVTFFVLLLYYSKSIMSKAGAASLKPV